MLIYHPSTVVSNQQPVDGQNNFVWKINMCSCLCTTIMLHLMWKTFTVLSISNVGVYVIKSVNKVTCAHTLMHSYIYIHVCTCTHMHHTSMHPQIYIQTHVHTDFPFVLTVNTHYAHTHWCACAHGCTHPKYHLQTPCDPHWFTCPTYPHLYIYPAPTHTHIHTVTLCIKCCSGHYIIDSNN